MPTYQYRCSDCGHEFDQYQKFSESTLTICPSCSGAIRRVIQPVGVVFKGSGWYINDSKKSETGSSTAPKKAEIAGAGDKTGVAATTESATSADKTEKAEKSESKESTPATKPSVAAGVAASA